MNLRKIKNEEGFWSAFIILFLVTLVLMSVGASVLMKSEGINIANQVQALEADYAANGGAYYGIERLELGPLNESETISIGNAAVTLDSADVGGSSEITLTVTATVGVTERQIVIRIQPGGGLRDKAIYTEGDVFNVTPKDSLGNPDNDLMVTGGDVPEIDVDSLNAMSTAQGHDQGAATFDPPDGYPNGSFYFSGNTPNVTHVLGNLKVNGGRTVYGIFVVEGNVELMGNSRVEGVIYLPNPTSTVMHGGGDPTESSITGGIVSHGDISGTGNHISVRHNLEYMTKFCEFQTGQDAIEHTIVHWTYQ